MNTFQQFESASQSDPPSAGLKKGRKPRKPIAPILMPKTPNKALLERKYTLDLIHQRIFKPEKRVLIEIFKTINIDNIEYLVICPLFNIFNRDVIAVHSIKYKNKKEIKPKQKYFYRSSGTSRGIHNKNIWYPGGIPDAVFMHIEKLEEKYFNKILAEKDYFTGEDIMINDKNIYENPETYFYSRFVNEENATISKYLYKNIRDKDIRLEFLKFDKEKNDTLYQYNQKDELQKVNKHKLETVIYFYHFIEIDGKKIIIEDIKNIEHFFEKIRPNIEKCGKRGYYII